MERLIKRDKRREEKSVGVMVSTLVQRLVRVFFTLVRALLWMALLATAVFLLLSTQHEKTPRSPDILHELRKNK